MKKMHLLLLASLSFLFLLTGCFEDEKDKKSSISLNVPEQITLIGTEFQAIDLSRGFLSGIDASNIVDLQVPASTNFSVELSGTKLNITTLKDEFWGTDTLTMYLEYEAGKILNFPLYLTVQTPPVIANIPPIVTIKPGQQIPSIPLLNCVTDLDDELTNLFFNVTATGNVTATVDPTTKVATITAINPQLVGTSTVTFVVKDSDGNSDTATVSVVISDGTVKTPPVITPIIPGQSIVKGGNFTPIPLYNHVTDADGSVMDITWKAEGAVNLAVTQGLAGALITVVDPNWIGSEVITFIATDKDNLSDRVAVTFIVTDSGTEKLPPVISAIPSQSIEKGQTFTAVNLQEYVTDPDGDKNLITWEATDPSELTVLIADKVLTVTPVDPEWTGSATVTLVAKDSDGLTATAAVKFKVTGGGIVIPANDWVFDKGMVITTIVTDSSVFQMPPSVDTSKQAATDTTEILSTTDDSVTVYAKQESVTTKATFSNNLKIGEGLLTGLSEEGIKDSLNANADLIASQIETVLPVEADSLTIVFNDVSFGEPTLTETEEELYVAYTIVVTATMTVYTNLFGTPVQLPVGVEITIDNLSTYKEYVGTIPPSNWPQIIVDAQ